MISKSVQSHLVVVLIIEWDKEKDLKDTSNKSPLTSAEKQISPQIVKQVFYTRH